jgi:ATP adenylyltransferase
MSGKKVDDVTWEEPMFRDAVLIEHKTTYIKKDKRYTHQTKDSCIICNVIGKDEKTGAYEIFRSDNFIIFLNLYPYTSGHLLISPLKHYKSYTDLNQDEIVEMGILTQRVMEMLTNFSNTTSFNLGWNEGLFGGGSIKHYHLHIVPRYKNEMNFMEIIARTRPFILSLESTEVAFKQYIPFLSGEKTLEELDIKKFFD